MANLVLFHQIGKKIGDKEVNLSADVLKAVLTVTAPNAANDDEVADITQISAAGGYAPVTLTTVTYTETGAGTGIWELNSDPVVFAASGANFDAARYMALYDDTATGDPLIGYVDYGTNFTVTDGNDITFTPGADGWAQLTVNP